LATPGVRAGQCLAGQLAFAVGTQRFVQHDELERAIGIRVQLLDLPRVKRGEGRRCQQGQHRDREAAE
jgi:hypothetical protein